MIKAGIENSPISGSMIEKLILEKIIIIRDVFNAYNQPSNL